MSACSQITAGVLIDCANPIISGAKDRLVLINRDQIDTLTRNNTNPQIIEAISLAGGSVGYVFEGRFNSVEPKQTMVKKRYARVYDHEVAFKVFSGVPLTKKQIELMAQGNLVAIVENNYQGASGEGAFEVYGLDTGLEVEALERVISDSETQGAYSVTLKTTEQNKEGHLPATLFVTDYTASKAVVDGLL